MTALEIVREALAEDARTIDGGHFDAEGFSNFNPEETPETISEAWDIYCAIVFRGEDRAEFGIA